MTPLTYEATAENRPCDGYFLPCDGNCAMVAECNPAPIAKGVETMDPNETLQQIREARDTCEALEPQQRAVRLALLDELSAHFDALDTWLVRGGFLPRDWQRKRDEVQP